MSVHTSHDDNDVLVDPRERACGGESQNKHACTNTVFLKQVKIQPWLKFQVQNSGPPKDSVWS